MIKINKKIAILIPILLMATVGLSAWVLAGFFGTSTGYVISTAEGEQPLQFTSTLDGNTLDTNEGSAEYQDYVDVFNTDGDINLTITSNTIKTDNTTDTCTDYINDCTVSINDSPYVISSSETYRIWVNVSCTRLSCPQTIETNLTISGETV